ncbi:MAG: hypothetical protein ACTSSJ_02555 [Candidatus Odinarchaeia archaeon]
MNINLPDKITKLKFRINLFELIFISFTVLSSFTTGLTYLTGNLNYQSLIYISIFLYCSAHILTFICLFYSREILKEGYLAKGRYTYFSRFFGWLALWNFVAVIIIGAMDAINRSVSYIWEGTLPDMFTRYFVTLSLLIYLILTLVFAVVEYGFKKYPLVPSHFK